MRSVDWYFLLVYRTHPFMLKQFWCFCPFLGVLFETSQKKIYAFWRCVFGKWRVQVLGYSEEGGEWPQLEIGRTACHEFNDRAPKGPDIYFGVDNLLPFDGLRSHPVRRSTSWQSFLVFTDINSNSKICYFQFSIFGEEKIKPLDIPVHNVEFMEVVKTFKNLKDVQFDEGLWKNRSFAQSSKRSSLNIL